MTEEKQIGKVLPAGAEIITHHKKKPLFQYDIDQDKYKDFMIDRAGKFIGGPFNITASISDFLEQSFHYFSGSEKGKYSPYKGLLIIGRIGNGKTTIMKMLKDFIFVQDNKIVGIINCKNLVNPYKEKPEDFYMRPFIFDDIGKDEQTANDYGTKIRPFEEIIAARYDKIPTRITFGTANFRIDGLDYNESIKDRMREMFNVVEFMEESFR